MNKCPFCEQMMTDENQGEKRIKVTCPFCGEYYLNKILSKVRELIPELSKRQRANIIGWLRKNHLYEISDANIEKLKSIKAPFFHERADLLLQFFEKQTDYAGEYIDEKPLWIAVSWCVNTDELNEIINFLRESNRIEDSGEMTGGYNLKICPDGWAHLEELKNINPESPQCFVAMWFDPDMQNVYDKAISVAIASAGYFSHRVDQGEHNGKIDDEIIAQIKKSRFILADFTGHRAGVYYEAGFAKGLGLEVIWTCREDDIDNLHFDIRQFNCITWKEEDFEDFKKKIKNRIEAVIGEGPNK